MYVVDKLGIKNAYALGVVMNICGAWIRHFGGQHNTPAGFYVMVAGQAIVSIASPFVTCLPAPLAAKWFAADEQALVSAA